MKALSLAPVIAGLLLAACSPDSAIDQATKGPKANPFAAAAAASDGGVANADAGAPALPPMPKMEFTENDFAESDRNRDPFRTFTSVLQPDSKRAAGPLQRLVVLPQYSLDELKLVAIVTGGEYPRAMVVDPGGTGWVLKRGDWVGRPEIVHVGGANGSDYQITWRVDKVRDGEIVFSREDPAQPGIPPASRVIALRTEADNQREKL